MDAIRFGMIGAGSISNNHLSALRERDDARLVAVADVNGEQAAAQAEKYGAERSCTDYRELVAADEVDAVIIGIPTRFHADAAIVAAEHGKHVLCEKPMARTLAECDAMIAAHAAAGTVLQIAFVCRFDDNWGQIRKLVLEGRAGRPCLWRRICCGSAPQPPYGAWYSDSRYSDGPLTESASHDIDFMRYTFGEVTAVTARLDHLSRVGDVLDNSMVMLEFEGGDQALMHWSWSLPPKAKAGFGGLDVVGPDGAIHQPTQRDGQWFATVATAGGEVEEVPFENRRDATTWFGGQLGNFLGAVRGEDTSRATALDGRKAHEVFCAAVLSSDQGRRVTLPLRD